MDATLSRVAGLNLSRANLGCIVKAGSFRRAADIIYMGSVIKGGSVNLIQWIVEKDWDEYIKSRDELLFVKNTLRLIIIRFIIFFLIIYRNFCLSAYVIFTYHYLTY